MITRNENRGRTHSECLSQCPSYAPLASLGPVLVSHTLPLTYSLFFSATPHWNRAVSHSLPRRSVIASLSQALSLLSSNCSLHPFFSCAATMYACTTDVLAFGRIAFLVLPLLNIMARTGLPIMDQTTERALHLTDADDRAQALVWCGITALLALSRLACLTFPLSILLVKENAPTPDSLGATNGLVLFAMCLTRSFCPAFVSILFSSLARSKILWGYLWVIIMATISYACSLLGRQIERSRRSSTDCVSSE